VGKQLLQTQMVQKEMLGEEPKDETIHPLTTEDKIGILDSLRSTEEAMRDEEKYTILERLSSNATTATQEQN
jgi:hypothetical protein